jgi:hypothetical protein
VAEDVHVKLNPSLATEKSIIQEGEEEAEAEGSFQQQIGLTGKSIEVLHLEHKFVWC